MNFRSLQVDTQPRTSAVSEKSGSGLQDVLDRDGDDVRIDNEVEKTNTSEDNDRPLETSFRHLWTDYNVDWKDTRRYHHSDASATSASHHRKLCMYISHYLV